MIKTVENNVAELSVEQLKKDNESLRREIKAALLTIDRLLKDLSKKNEHVKHLENIVNQTAPVLKKEQEKITLTVDSETEIAETQLERLRQASKNRSLTLEEIRAFDLLVKNKRLSQDESTINLSKASYRDVSDVALLQIATVDDTNQSEN